MIDDLVNWDDNVTKRWIDGITRPSTQRYYKTAFRIYVGFTGKNPASLIEEAMDDERRGPLEKQDVVIHRLLSFFNWLRTEYNVRSRGRGKHVVVGKGVSEKAASTYVNVIRSFYDTFGISVKLKGRHSLPKGRSLHKRMRVGADQVRTLVDYARNLRDKAIILILFQSGMDVATLCSMAYKDVKGGLENGENPLRLDLYRPKTGVEYFTFIGKDAIDALQVYIKDCISRGIEFKLDTPLFLTGKGKEPIETHNVQNMMKGVACRAGFISSEVRESNRFYNPLGPHALRESFGSIMINSGVPDSIVDFLLGHEIGDMARAYKGAQFESVKKMYSERDHLLSILKTQDLEKMREKITEDVKEEAKKWYGDVIGENVGLRQNLASLQRKLIELEERQRRYESFTTKFLEMSPEDLELLAKLIHDKKQKDSMPDSVANNR